MEGLRVWCRGMTANQVNFFMSGSILLALLSFTFLCAALVFLRRRGAGARSLCGGLMALSAGTSWVFLSLVLMQSGKILLPYYGQHLMIPVVYLLFLVGGVLLATPLGSFGRHKTAK